MKTKRSLFLLYLMTYMLVCSSAIAILGAYLYSTNVSHSREILDQRYQADVDRTAESLDNTISNLHEIAMAITSRRTTDAISEIPRPVPVEYVTEINAYYRELQPFAFANDNIEEVFLYFKQNELFISSNRIGLYPQVFYAAAMHYQDLEYEQWKEIANAKTSIAVFKQDQGEGTEQTLDLLIGMPDIPSIGTNSAVMIARVFTKIFTQGLENELAYDAVAILRDFDGNIVFGNSKDTENAIIQDEDLNRDYVPFAAEAENFGWTLQLWIPNSYFTQAKQQFLRTFWALTLAAFLAGTLISVGLSRWGIAPFRKLLSIFRNEFSGPVGEGKNEYQRLDAHIHRMLTDNQTLSDEVENYQSANRVYFMERLLGAGFSSPEEMHSIAKLAGIPLNASLYGLAIVELLGYHDDAYFEFVQVIDQITISIAALLQRTNRHGMTIFKVDFKHIALLFPLDDPRQSVPLPEYLEEMSTMIDERLNARVCSIYCDQPTEPNSLGLVYALLCRRMREQTAENQPECHVIRADRIINETFHYSIDMETRLLANLLAGNRNETMKLLEYIYTNDIRANRLSFIEVKQMMAAIKTTLIRACEEITIQDAALETSLNALIYFHSEQNVDDRWNCIITAADMLCGVVEKKTQQRNTDLVERINRMIDNSYHDPQLDLDMIAGKFFLTGNYLSVLYKNVTGINISAAIENKRMQKARELLEEETRTVQDISQKVGYTNINTFYKAFRRVYGLSPKKYAVHSRISQDKETET